MVTTVTGLFPYRLQPLNSIAPFTYRDGTTYQELLEQLRVYVNDTMRPEFNTEMSRIIDDFQAGIENAETRIIESETEYDELIADAKAYVDASVQFINNKTGPADIQRFTLDGPFTVEPDPVWPNNHPVMIVLTQDETGGHAVTWDDDINGTVPVDTAPNAVTAFWLVPEGDGSWAALRYIDATEFTDALALKANASSLATTNTNLTNLTTTVGTKADAAGTTASLALKSDKATAVTAPVGLEVVLGVLRNTGTGWEVLDDAGHTPLNIDSVSTSATHITVNYASMGVTDVGSFTVVPDDALASFGFFAGASVGLEQATITLSQSGATYADYVHYDGTNWISANGVFTDLTFTGGELTVTHPPIIDDGSLNVALTPRMGTDASYTPVISGAAGSVTATSLKIQFRTSADALQAVANTNMRVYISHGGGNRLVDPTTVTTAKYANSNLFITGLMKV